MRDGKSKVMGLEGDHIIRGGNQDKVEHNFECSS